MSYEVETSTGRLGKYSAAIYWGRTMEIFGHGIDVVDLDRIRFLVDDKENDFVESCFTLAELAYAGEGVEKIERLAGRFATKEATLKALGTGWGKDIAWTDVETRNLESGAPQIILNGQALRIANELGVVRWIVTTSHTKTTAVASVIALSISD